MIDSGAQVTVINPKVFESLDLCVATELVYFKGSDNLKW